ncbi:general transcription factor 3C polypeptide 3 [Ciona intestinalis]
MWGSENSSDAHTVADSEKPSDANSNISAVSSAFNIPSAQLEQFMAGNVTLETLAACQQVPDHETAFPSHPMYETSSFTDVMTGSSSSTPIRPISLASHPQWSTSDVVEITNPFRSPPSQNNSSLMELQTVTPSRIQHSPTKILSQRKTKPGADMSPSTSRSQSFLHHDTSALSDIQMHTYTSPIQNKPEPDSGQRFQIIIGGKRKETVTKENTRSALTPSVSTFEKMTDEGEAMEEDIDEKDDIDEEDRQNVQDIQRALNIEGDVLTEKRKQGASSRLPRELRGLMGEANLCYARGDHDDAIKMCMEIIRLVPYAAEPFETLSMIYDERGEPERSLQYSLLAAHLSPRDADQWLHLANMCLKQNENTKAINCYTKAFKVRPDDYNIVWENAKLHQKLGLFHKAMALYKIVVGLMPKSLSVESVSLARDMAKTCHSNNESMLAVDLLEQALEHQASAFKDEDANMLCELLLLLGRYENVLEVLCLHSSLILYFSDETALKPKEKIGDRDISGMTLSSDLAIDLQCKVAVAMIRLNKSSLVEEITSNICSHNPKDIGDLYFDMAEAYSDVGEHEEALKVLNLLVTSPDYSLAAVWLKHAECERLCGNLERALKSYKQCVRLAPGHVEAHIKFAESLKLANKYSEANKTLEEADSYEADPDIRMKLHLTRFQVLKEWGEKSRTNRLSKFSLAADVALLMFANRLGSAFSEGNIAVIKRKNTLRNSAAGDVRLVKKTSFFWDSDKDSNVFLDGNPSIFTNEQWITLFKETAAILVRCQRYKDVVRLGDGAQWLASWYDNAETRNLLERVVLSAGMIGGDYANAYNVVRQWLISGHETNHLWNIFNQITARTGEIRHHRFCLRRLVKVPNHLALTVLNGNNWLASGSYKHALGEYERAHKMDPENPLYLLLLGVVYFHIASQKYSEHKHSLIVQGIAFLDKYRKLRNIDQESFYNMGRALHQIGLETYAVLYYKRALAAPPPTVKQQNALGHQNIVPKFDLTCEIGYNLSLIYRKSGNTALANSTLSTYCIV